MERIDRARDLKVEKRTKVFRWLEDVNTGVRARNLVGKKKKNKTLRKYARSQMFYSSVTDEWDVCTAYDSDAPKPDDSDEVGKPKRTMIQEIVACLRASRAQVLASISLIILTPLLCQTLMIAPSHRSPSQAPKTSPKSYYPLKNG